MEEYYSVTVNLLTPVVAAREKERRAKERKRQMFVKSRKQKETELIKDYRGLRIVLLLSSQSGDESQMTSCHFSLALLLLLGT